jgi:vacuolar-type H+-ATPase subunit H
MHQPSEHPEFVKTIREIRDAEEEHDRLVASSKEKADKLLREAKERVIAERTKAEEEAVDFKNEKLKVGHDGIEADVEKIVDKAKDEGSKISKKKLDAAAVSKLVKGFVGDL